MISKTWTSASFASLLHRLCEGDGARVPWTWRHNVFGSEWALVSGEMEAVVLGNAYVEKPCYHVATYWHPGDGPQREEMRAAGLALLEALEMVEHQAFMVAHAPHGEDEEEEGASPHLHLVVNRVHPLSAKAASTWNALQKMWPAQRELERRYGWAKGRPATLEEHWRQKNVRRRAERTERREAGGKR